MPAHIRFIRGRARSYLIKAGIPFIEVSTGHESFRSEVLQKSKLATVPTQVAGDGEVIRDGAVLIEHFEIANGRPFQLNTPRQQVLSALFDLIGTDGLLRLAMHYRWAERMNRPDHDAAEYLLQGEDI